MALSLVVEIEISSLSLLDTDFLKLSLYLSCVAFQCLLAAHYRHLSCLSIASRRSSASKLLFRPGEACIPRRTLHSYSERSSSTNYGAHIEDVSTLKFDHQGTLLSVIRENFRQNYSDVWDPLRQDPYFLHLYTLQSRSCSLNIGTMASSYQQMDIFRLRTSDAE